jgi:hypothetical protein
VSGEEAASAAPVTLQGFLAARLDEDEAAALYAAGPGWFLASAEDPDQRSVRFAGPSTLYGYGESLADYYIADRIDVADAEHIARHDPARVLREVAAGRAILAMYEDAAQAPYDLPEGVSEGRDDDERERDQYLIDVLDDVVRHLAAVYGDHPGYRAEWKPQEGCQDEGEVVVEQ